MTTTMTTPMPSPMTSTEHTALTTPDLSADGVTAEDAKFAAYLQSFGLQTVDLPCVEPMPEAPEAPAPVADGATAAERAAHAAAVAAYQAAVDANNAWRPRILPAADGQPAVLTLQSLESPAGRLAYLEAAAAMQADAGNAPAVQTAALRLLAQSVVGWTLPIAYTPERALQLFAHVPWLRDLVDVTLEDRARFLPAPATR